jgi:hypothetical protein
VISEEADRRPPGPSNQPACPLRLSEPPRCRQRITDQRSTFDVEVEQAEKAGHCNGLLPVPVLVIDVSRLVDGDT